MYIMERKTGENGILTGTSSSDPDTLLKTKLIIIPPKINKPEIIKPRMARNLPHLAALSR